MHEKSAIQVDSSPNCTSKPNPKTKVHLINATCLNGKENATISVYDNMLDGVYQIPLTPHPTVAHDVVGGHTGHQFVITCKDIPNQGISKTVAHVFQGRVYNQLPDNYKEVSPVEMRFKAVNDLSAPDISSVYIGDEFYMFIKYMGVQNYSVIPETCTAFGETWISKGLKTNQTNSVELWNIQKYNDQSCAKHKELLEGFYTYNKTLIYTKMFGFRFAGKDKGFVTIACHVKIYNNITVSGNKNLCMRIPTVRKKRHIENAPFQTRTLTKKLQVFDNKNVHLAENNGLRIKWDTILWMTIFAAVTQQP
ncbi:uncharacterized protein LOC134272853 [Saccostrea cucullata]|uniref:uncharacterized protein LOC134272853 n=1 Tax=Saccostrea cuccullata TaxID=36930 RepID=UPI002ED2FFA3